MVDTCLKWFVFGSFRNSKEGPSAFDALIHACDREGSYHVATQLMAEWGQQVTALLGSTGDLWAEDVAGPQRPDQLDGCEPRDT
jgi:hypothetical protein